jgi:hypothetical protein
MKISSLVPLIFMVDFFSYRQSNQLVTYICCDVSGEV